MKDINAIPIFTAVVEHKSFSKAAEQLNITTSAVSKRITGLEQQLGVRLLMRSTRKLSLTEAGERYYEYAQQALLAAEAAYNVAIESRVNPRGVLKVNAPLTVGNLYLAPLIPAFLRRFPHIEFHLTLNDVFTPVSRDDFDVVLSSSALLDPSLKAAKIAPTYGMACASPDYLEAHGFPTVPEDLFKHNCLLYSWHTVPHEWIFIKQDEPVTVSVSGNYRCNNPNAVREAAIQGAGIACLPTFLVSPDIEAGRLLRLFKDYTLPSRVLYALYREKGFVSAKVKAFIDYLQESLPPVLMAMEDQCVIHNSSEVGRKSQFNGNVKALKKR